jgi:hypothetical protein
VQSLLVIIHVLGVSIHLFDLVFDAVHHPEFSLSCGGGCYHVLTQRGAVSTWFCKRGSGLGHGFGSFYLVWLGFFTERRVV